MHSEPHTVSSLSTLLDFPRGTALETAMQDQYLLHTDRYLGRETVRNVLDASI